MEIRPHTPPSTREPDPVSRTCQRGDKDLGYVFSNLPSSAAEEGLGVGAFDVGSAVEELALADPAAVAEPGSDPPIRRLYSTADAGKWPRSERGDRQRSSGSQARSSRAIM